MDTTSDQSEANGVLEVEIGTAVPLEVQSTFFIKSEDNSVISLTPESEGNIETEGIDKKTADVAPIATTRPIKINLKKVLEQNEVLHLEVEHLKQQLAIMSNRMVSMDVENRQLKDLVSYLQEQLHPNKSSTFTHNMPDKDSSSEIQIEIDTQCTVNVDHLDSSSASQVHIVEEDNQQFDSREDNCTDLEYLPSTDSLKEMASVIVTSPKAIENSYKAVIREHEIRTTSKFVQVYSAKKHDFGCFDIERLLNDLPKKIRFGGQYGGSNIPYNGMPFILMGSLKFVCHHGKSYSTKKLKNDDNSTQFPKRRQLHPSKKVDCPAVCSVHHLIYFPDFKIETTERPNHYRANSICKRVREELNRNASTLTMEHRILYRLSLEGDHRNHLTGKGSGRQLPMDRAVLAKIKELVLEHGVTTSTEMRKYLTSFVQTNFPHVSEDNSSYYPSNKSILNQLYKTKIQAGIYHKHSRSSVGYQDGKKKKRNTSVCNSSDHLASVPLSPIYSNKHVQS